MTKQIAECCPTCGRAYAKPKAPKANGANYGELAAEASVAERFAYFKRTAPLEDARFIYRTGAPIAGDLDRDWGQHIDAIEEGRAGTPSQIHKRTRQLQERWRKERNAVDRAAVPVTSSLMPHATAITFTMEAAHAGEYYHTYMRKTETPEGAEAEAAGDDY